MSTEGASRLDHVAIEERAARWLARHDSEALSLQDKQEFDAWMIESMANRVAYWRLRDAWESALRFKALGAGIQSDDPPPPGQWNLSPFFGQRTNVATRKLGSSLTPLRAIAASFGLALLAGAVWYAWFIADSFSTPIGAVASLPIEDGSKVTLNTDSRIKVAISDTERRIELKSGEAFFEVAKDPVRPFVVSVADRRVVALGTSFSVRKGTAKDEGNIHVIVTEGAVRIESAGGAVLADASGFRLAAGDIASTTGERLLIRRHEPRAAQEELSWRGGVLIFRNVTLEHAAAEFNRYNKRKIVIEDPTAAGLAVAGSFRTTNLDSFLQIVEKGYPLRVEVRGNDFVVSSER